MGQGGRARGQNGLGARGDNRIVLDLKVGRENCCACRRAMPEASFPLPPAVKDCQPQSLLLFSSHRLSEGRDSSCNRAGSCSVASGRNKNKAATWQPSESRDQDERQTFRASTGPCPVPRTSWECGAGAPSNVTVSSRATTSARGPDAVSCPVSSHRPNHWRPPCQPARSPTPTPHLGQQYFAPPLCAAKLLHHTLSNPATAVPPPRFQALSVLAWA
jgi:hypothetical protein